MFLAHFYTRNVKIKLKSDKKLHPLNGPIYRSKQKAKWLFYSIA
jgi:hypothetical protein